MPTAVKREGSGAVRIESERLMADVRIRLVGEEDESEPVRLVTPDASLALDLPGFDTMSSCGPEMLNLQVPIELQAAQRLLDFLWRCGVRPSKT